MLISIILGKSVARGLYDEPVNKPYRKLEVDEMPIIETLEKLDYKKILDDYENNHGKPLRPVIRRKNSVVKVPADLICPKCAAPSAYLYANNGDKGRYLCKVCECLFSKDRKSTRLNSSHVATSYAGFCLYKRRDRVEAIV